MAPFHPRVTRPVCSLLACTCLLALLTASAVTAAGVGNNGPDFVPLGAPLAAQIIHIATSPALANVVLISLVSADHQVLAPQYSLDAGQTWQVVMSVPLDPNPAVEVALAPRGNPDPQQNVRILLGDRDHIYRTGDYGHTWATTFTDDGSGYQSLFVSPANPQRLYSMFGFGWRWPEDLNYQDFARSDDAGVTWSVVKGLVTISGCGQFTPSPILPARAYLDCDGWNQSDDGGQTWTPKTLPGLELALDAQDPAWLYMLDLDVYGNPIFGRSTDGGGTWTPWSSTPCVTDHVMPDWLMAHPSKTHVLFLNCSSGLYRSTDAGDHWSQLTSTTGPLLAPDYGVPGRILWARQDGLWASMDDGDHWQLLYGLYQTSWAFLPLIQR